MTSWPPLGAHLNDHGGDWAGYDAYCYEVYCAGLKRSKPTWPVDGQEFSIRHNPEVDGLCRTYVHLTSTGAVEDEREPDLARCERIDWPRQLVEEFNHVYPGEGGGRVIWWMNERSTSRGLQKNYVISLPDFSYVVIVASRPTFALLVTAYQVEFDSRRRKLKREFEEYWRTRR